MSGKDLLSKSLASHRAKMQAEKRKSRAQEEGRGMGVKQIGNYFKHFGGRDQVRRQNHAHSSNFEPTSVEPDGSEIIPFDESIGVKNILNSIHLEQDIIEESKNQLKRKKKEANRETEWKSRMKDKEDAWDYKRDVVFQHYVSSRSYNERQCCSCKKTTSYPVRCFTCKQDLCSKCDEVTHCKLVLHNREICVNGEDLRVLQPSEFLCDEGTITVKEVSVPIIVPSCPDCKGRNTCMTKPGSRDVAVITANGRWDMKSTRVECNACLYWFEAKAEDYFASGFQPSSAVDESSFYLICTELLEWCWHFQHKMPGISMNKVVETIKELSEIHNRCNSLSNTEFLMAMREYEFNRIRIQDKILRVEHMKCKACGVKPLACHCDGNMKCYRYESAQGHGARELLENVAIAKNEEVETFLAEVNKAIPETKGNATCGGSTFKAGKSDSHSHSKKMDETGIVCMCCRHGLVLSAANIRRGETYRVIAFLQWWALQFGILFFCYDVICRYWPFAKKLGNINPKFACLTQKMKPFLSRFHGKAHAWSCQVLWFGHFRKGAAATVGEEMELGFSKISRYNASTKHMTSSNRNDHLSKGFIYENASKEKKMVFTLPKRLKTAKKNVIDYGKEFRGWLEKLQLQEDDMPKIMRQLVSQAKQVRDKRVDGNWTVGNIQVELEGIALAIRQLQAREMKFADSAKARTVHRRKIVTLKARSDKLIAEIKDKYGIVVLEEHKKSGIFPWYNSVVSVSDQFQVVNAWMLEQRFREEVTQTEKEMATFIENVYVLQGALEKDIHKIKEQSTLTGNISAENKQFDQGQIVLKKLEIARWKKVLADATMLFDVETDFLDVEMFAFDVKNDFEDLLLDNIVYEEDGDEENEADEEYDKEETIDYQDYGDGESMDFQDYDEEDHLV